MVLLLSMLSGKFSKFHSLSSFVNKNVILAGYDRQPHSHPSAPLLALWTLELHRQNVAVLTMSSNRL